MSAGPLGAGRARRALAWLVGLASLWVAWSWLSPQAAAPASHEPAPAFTGWSFNPFAEGRPLDSVQFNADAAREADAARVRVLSVWERGSLRGTQLDGSWGVFVDGTLRPAFALRQRFDYLLTSLGEASPDDLRHWIEQEVTAELGLSAARQVLAVWDHYLVLQHTTFRAQADPKAPETWTPALAERSTVRRRILGDDWAQAFYADEERAFVALAQSLATPRDGSAGAAAAEPVPLLHTETRSDAQSVALHAQRVQQFGAEAAERLRNEEALWADWEQRLQSARERVLALQAAPELSTLQRGQASEALLAQAFEGHELTRARALLLAGR